MQMPERLGKYLVRRELGRGAMGVVYEAHDPLIDRDVALKVLNIDTAHAAQAAELRLRFRREAQAAGRLTHPNIVSVYDYGEADDTASAYIAMELIVSRDLKQLFDAGARYSLPETARIMAELLAALQHAHDRGVVHRDIKPANILLLDNGSVKVADFGIAKLDSSDLTQVGSVLGTVSYMSPEQLTGAPVDRRSDLFSCGVLLYQLLTGTRPFNGSPATVMHQVLHVDPPAPSSLVPTLPTALDGVLRQALAKDPAQRHDSAEAFAAALRAALGGGHDADATVRDLAVPAPAPAAGRRRAIAGGVVVLAALGLAYALLPMPPREHTPPEPAPPASVPVAMAPAMAEPAAAVAAAAAEAPPVPVPVPAPKPATPAPTPTPTPNTPSPSPSGKAVAQSPKPAPVASAPLPRAPASAPVPDAFGSVRVARPAPSAMPAEPGRTASSAGEAECAAQARRGNARCQVLLGDQLRSGKGERPDLAAAAGWYRKAAEQGDAAGQYELGTMLAGGLGVPMSAFQAMAWFQKAADQGHARAQNRLGLAYERGSGGQPNLVLAAQWYRKAAEQGQAAAQANLGRLHLQGRGVFKDTAQAALWLQRAADQGEPNAKFHLATMYATGDGKARDKQQAVRLYREALGNPALSERSRTAARNFLAADP